MSEEEIPPQPQQLQLPHSESLETGKKHRITPDQIDKHPELKIKREDGVVYAFIGLPGSGKTTVAKMVAERFSNDGGDIRQVHETDPIRFELTSGKQEYTDEENKKVYNTLHSRVKEDARTGFAVLSGTYWSEESRANLESEVAEIGGKVTWIEVITEDESVAKQRIDKRKEAGTDASVVSTNPTDYNTRIKIHQKYQYLQENHLTIDNEGTLEELNASLDKVIS